ncbi:unnamed protein product [Moneuplotes crassus]|uniref:Uncharacterized protein n=1 Tax=Euplotes crassus TaxID=5936 RepID=A0AAD1U7M3_EUPCR|nr:unnamed protein product [Moneuplotes crassus]
MIQGMPRCKTYMDCEKIAYMVRKSADNALKQDLFVCSMCMMTHYSDQVSEPIPEIDPITECLNSAQHNLNKIECFRQQHKLDEVWDGVLPQLEEFNTTYKKLKEELQAIKANGRWNKLVDFQVEIKTFLNLIFDSELMKKFNRELHCREFKESKSADSMTNYMSQAAVRAKVQEIQQTIIAEQVNPLKEVLRRATERDREKNAQLERLEQDKEELDQTIQALTQEKNSFEQVSSERQQEILNLTQTAQTLTEEQKTNNGLIEEMKEQILNLDNTLEQSKHTLSYQEFKKIQNSICGSSNSFNESSSVCINLSNTSSQDLLKTLQLFRLPPLASLDVCKIYNFNHPEVITKFIENSLSEHIKYFRFSTGSISYPSISAYMGSLQKTLPLIPDKVELVHWAITKQEFEDLMLSCQHSKYAYFYGCKILTDSEIDFKDRLDQASFTAIDFNYTGHSGYTNWSEDGFMKFKNIVKGFAKVESIKNRHIDIHLGNCGMSKSQAEAILQENGLTKMNVKDL